METENINNAEILKEKENQNVSTHFADSTESH